jgi:hypothetical protein
MNPRAMPAEIARAQLKLQLDVSLGDLSTHDRDPRRSTACYAPTPFAPTEYLFTHLDQRERMVADENLRATSSRGIRYP